MVSMLLLDMYRQEIVLGMGTKFELTIFKELSFDQIDLFYTYIFFLNSNLKNCFAGSVSHYLKMK